MVLFKSHGLNTGQGLPACCILVTEGSLAAKERASSSLQCCIFYSVVIAFLFSSVQSNSLFQNSEIRLLEGKIQEITTDLTAEKNYKVDLRGIYIVIETTQGMTLMWDQKTTVIVQLAPSFQVGRRLRVERLILKLGLSFQEEQLCASGHIYMKCYIKHLHKTTIMQHWQVQTVANATASRIGKHPCTAGTEQ